MWYHTIGERKGEGWNLVVTEILENEGLAARVKGAKVLDLGCAEGGYALWAIQQGAKKVLGVELNLDMIERQKVMRKMIPKKRFTCYNARIEDKVETLRDGGYEVVFFMNIHHHLDNPVDVLTEVCKKVAPGGILVTNGYQLSTPTGPAAHGRTKIQTANVCSILSSAGLESSVVTSYREQRDMVLGVRPEG
jgi:2-polyprenyl-3-methyl-5-hydroxy-6-metoxy-1,4-benzoquinol methylase